jgi:hypothetical protein
MKEPRARIIGEEANGDVVAGLCTEADDVAARWVVKVVGRLSGTAHDVKVVLHHKVSKIFLVRAVSCSRRASGKGEGRL